MSGDVEVVLIAIGVTLFVLFWAALVAWAAWRFGKDRE